MSISLSGLESRTYRVLGLLTVLLTTSCGIEASAQIQKIEPLKTIIITSCDENKQIQPGFEYYLAEHDSYTIVVTHSQAKVRGYSPHNFLTSLINTSDITECQLLQSTIKAVENADRIVTQNDIPTFIVPDKLD